MLKIALAVAVCLVGCKEGNPNPEERASRITVHRVGDGCVALFVAYNKAAMAVIPCPTAEAP